MPNYTINICGLPTEASPNDPGPVLASCELVDCPVELIRDNDSDTMSIPMYGYNGIALWVVNNPRTQPV